MHKNILHWRACFIYLFYYYFFFYNPNDDIKTHYLRSDKILVSMYHKKHVQFC